MAGKLRVLNVEPLSLPALDGFFEVEIEVGDAAADADAESSNLVGGSGGRESLYVIKLFPQTPVRCYAEEAFAQSNEKSEMEDSVWSELVKLHPVDK